MKKSKQDTIYYISKKGSDTNTGSEEDAFLTIQRAVDQSKIDIDEEVLNRIANKTANRIFVLAAIVYCCYYFGKLFF